MRQYVDLVKNVLSRGTRKENRTGVDTISTFGEYYEVDLANGFPLLTTKYVSWKNIVVENLWFLSGSTNVKFLHRHGVHFWDAWVDKKGNVPSAYGAFWRHFPVHGFDEVVAGGSGEFPTYDPSKVAHHHNDQVAWVIEELKKNPMSRRMVVSAWAPGNAQTSKLPPCHAMFVLNVQNEVSSVPDFDNEEHSLQTGPDWVTKRLCLHLTQRSCDVALGVPYNLAGYAFLTHLFARFAGLAVGTFGHSLVDAHVYTSKPDGSKAEFDHVPGLKEQIRRMPWALPRLVIDPSIQTLGDVEKLLDPSVRTERLLELFRLDNYRSHEAIPFKVAV